MFLWKQMLDVWCNRGRCVAIIYRPYLFWKTEEDDEMMPEIPKTTTVVVESADILESSHVKPRTSQEEAQIGCSCD